MARPSSAAPEDATSYAEFLDRLGRERAGALLHTLSLSSRLRWVAATVTFPVAFLFLLAVAVLGRSAPWWEWAVGIGCAVAFTAIAADATRSSIRGHRRRRELDDLARVWRGRAERGEIPLSSAADPDQREREESHARWQLELAREEDRAEKQAQPSPRAPSSIFMLASVGLFGLSAACVYAGFVVAAMRGPSGAAVALVAAMPSFGILGLILAAVYRSRERADLARLGAISKRAMSAQLSSSLARASAATGVPVAQLRADLDAASKRADGKP